jgi:hypothetical protein
MRDHLVRGCRTVGLLTLLAAAGCSDESAIGPGPVASVFVSPTSFTIDAGQTGTVEGMALDAQHAKLVNKKVHWKSRNTTVALVDDGAVTAMALGQTYLVASVEGFSDSALVTVANPDMALDQSVLTFTASQSGGDPAPQTVNVTSARGGPLTGLTVGTISYGPGPTNWLTALLNQATAPAVLTVQATTGSLTQGSYTATVPITSPAAGNSPQSVSITFNVGPAGPAILATPSSLTFGTIVGGTNPPSQVINLTNGGGGTLTGLGLGTITYGVGASNWISSAQLSGANAPATLTIQVTTGSLAIGSYTATVPVTSGVASNSPLDVSVTFDVLAVDFTTDVQPIFTNRCLNCHFSGGTPPNLTAGSSLAALVNVSSSCGSTPVRVVPGDPTNSQLFRKIEGTQAAGCGTIMPPPPASPLPQGEIDIIRQWILGGAQP